jgi:hypothetical protein
LRIHSNVEPVGMLASRLINEATVSRPDVYHHAPIFIGCDEVMECSSIELVESFAANYLEHKLIPFCIEYSSGYCAVQSMR